jgi:hypothetical protein
VSVQEKHPDPAAELGALVTKVFNVPVMGMGGGSLTEERAQDRHNAECVAELSRLRGYSRPAEDPEFHMVLDVLAKILRI